jgi:hypothetical protein
MVTMEDGDDERSIVTPDLRLRFRRLGELWTHAIDLGPGPWITVAEAVEWSSSGGVRSPVYQDVRFQADEDAVVARAVGRVGDRELSASFRIWHTAWEHHHFELKDIYQKRWKTYLEVDIVGSGPTPGVGVEARYDTFTGSLLSDARYHEWEPSHVWEHGVPDNYGLFLDGATGAFPSHVMIVEGNPPADWMVRVAPRDPRPEGTVRLIYTWIHERVQVFDKATMRRIRNGEVEQP